MKDLYRKRFKKIGGEFINDVSQYLREYIINEPEITITIGNDSKQRRGKTIYANTIMFYNHDIKNGAHIVFYRESFPKIVNTFTRLHKEAESMFELGNYLHDNLKDFYTRKDLSENERKRYKLHLLREQGHYTNVYGYEEELLLKNLFLSEEEKVREYKLVDIHLDFNYQEGINSKNKSYAAYKAAVPWLRSNNFRVWTKPNAPAASTAADLLLK